MIEALRAIDWRNVAVRAAWTFAQVFLATFIISAESIIDLIFNADWRNLMTLLVATSMGAVAAGLSAVKTVLVDVVRELKSSAELWNDKK